MSTMHEEILDSKKGLLAIAIAQGVKVDVWASKNDVPRSTAFSWAKQPAVRAAVHEWRREALDRAIGMMAGRSTHAVKVITDLSEGAESESVKLRAARAILSEQIAVAKFSDLEGRIGEMLAHVEAQTGERAP